MRDTFSIVHNKNQVNALTTMLKRFSYDWKRDEVSMAIFRKASKPMLLEGRAQLLSSVPELSKHADVQFRAKKDKTGTIMRVGLVGKGRGNLGHLFNFGTVNRIQNSSGRSTGKMTASGWWDRAVTSAKPQVEAEITKVAPAIIGRFVRKYKR